MDEVIRVVAARIPDRNLLLALLSDNGHDARPVNGSSSSREAADLVIDVRLGSLRSGLATV